MPKGIYERGSKAKNEKKTTKPAKKSAPKALVLTELELAKMEKLSTQIRAVDSEQVITLSQRNAYIQKIDPSGVLSKLEAKVNALKQERQEAESSYRSVSADVEKRLNIKLSEYAYDDVTGVLRNILEDGVPSPDEGTA
jgi:hypothetical protein